jgi:hypothetical protein
MNLRTLLLSLLGVAVGMANAVFAKHPETVEEALKCMVNITVSLGEGEVGKGSGFFVEENGTQWLYTNAHVIDGAKRISIKDSEGRAVKGFGRFQCYSLRDGGAVFNGAVIGADGVRFELKSKRELAFSLPEKFPEVLVDDKVLTLGDNHGKGNMNVLPGTIEQVLPTVYATTCETERGSSGGVLLLEDGLIPIGLNTWGFPVPATPFEGVWRSKDDVEMVAGASNIEGVSWITMPIVKFLKAKDEADKLVRAVMVLSIIYKLAPDESGFVYFVNDELVKGVTMHQALELLEDDPIIAPIFKIQQKLQGRGKGNIGVNKMELARLFHDGISESRKNYAKRMASIEKNYPPFYQIEHKTSGILKVGTWTDSNLEKAEDWFQDKIKLGGILPVGKWYAKYTFDEILWD